ncbi:hypothetical protein CFP56_025257 [Quercus suber]|uniref:Uncharacterized protein n=1 Tax=Quercus suber TaxID=58331 RepID=A0AAW0K525_QUESU
MPGEDHTKVSEVLAPNSQWNLNRLTFDLPMSIIKQIQATPLSDFNVIQDKLIWSSHAVFAQSNCSFPRDLWLTFSFYHPTPNFFDTPIHQWCKTNIQTNITVNNIPWYILFPFILWSIWLSRNSPVFSNIYIALSQLRKTGIHHATEFYYLNAS